MMSESYCFKQSPKGWVDCMDAGAIAEREQIKTIRLYKQHSLNSPYPSPPLPLS